MIPVGHDHGASGLNFTHDGRGKPRILPCAAGLAFHDDRRRLDAVAHHDPLVRQTVTVACDKDHRRTAFLPEAGGLYGAGRSISAGHHDHIGFAAVVLQGQNRLGKNIAASPIKTAQGRITRSIIPYAVLVLRFSTGHDRWSVRDECRLALALFFHLDNDHELVC